MVGFVRGSLVWAAGFAISLLSRLIVPELVVRFGLDAWVWIWAAGIALFFFPTNLCKSFEHKLLKWYANEKTNRLNITISINVYESLQSKLTQHYFVLNSTAGYV